MLAFLAKSYRELAMASVDAVLVAGDDKVDAAVVLLSLLHREADVVIEDLLDGATDVGDLSGALEPLN